MNKIVFINTVCNGSTGKLVYNIAKGAEKEGFETVIFYGRGKSGNDLNCKKICSKFSVFFHVFLARIGFNGHGSYFSTKKLIKELKRLNPNIIHIHNIHGYYLNLKLFFKYLKTEYKGKIIWELHDCWAFTGNCSYFTYAKCNKWKKACHNCQQLNNYPKTIFDTTKKQFLLKKKLFNNLENTTIITPSKWLYYLVKDSFLSNYKIKKIYNGIDLNVFKPIIDTNIYSIYNIPNNKKIFLGIANIWEERKGLSIFLEMSKLLGDDEIIVLIGLNNDQIKQMPKNIIGINKTENQEELVKLYSIADVFINPSVEETFSLVTVEAMACGLPVVVCGYSAPKELILNKYGVIINNHNAINYYKACKQLLMKKINKKNIISNAKKFDINLMIKENIKLYKEL